MVDVCFVFSSLHFAPSLLRSFVRHETRKKAISNCSRVRIRNKLAENYCRAIKLKLFLVWTILTEKSVRSISQRKTSQALNHIKPLAHFFFCLARPRSLHYFSITLTVTFCNCFGQAFFLFTIKRLLSTISNG